MNRTRFQLSTACLLSVIGATSYVWSQQGDQVARPQAGMRALQPAGKPATVRLGGRINDADEDDRPRGMMGRLGVVHTTPIHGPTRRRVVTEIDRVERVIEVPISEEELQVMKEFQDALSILKVSKDEAARKTASETIQAQLVKQFEQDLKQRQEELTSVEERVTSLRQQLEKRKSSQSEIISLRLKTIINNADGLGFPGEPDTVESSLSTADPNDVLMRSPGRPLDAGVRSDSLRRPSTFEAVPAKKWVNQTQ